jgi:hypothetical protein
MPSTGFLLTADPNSKRSRIILMAPAGSVSYRRKKLCGSGSLTPVPLNAAASLRLRHRKIDELYFAAPAPQH